MTAADLVAGDRVEMAAHTDRWMQGDRFAKVEEVGPLLVVVRFERSGQRSRLHPVQFERKISVPVVEEEDEEPVYQPKPGDTCYSEGDNIVHDSRCPMYPAGTIVNKQGRVVGRKDI